MKQIDLIIRARSYVRDFNGNIFREDDMRNYLNEAIDRIRSIKELNDIKYLTFPDDVPLFIPEQYHYMIAIYMASRCFFQDEQSYQASTLMNEFETKLDELKSGIENGDIKIYNQDGSVKEEVYEDDYVKDIYFDKIISDDELIH